MKPHKHAELIKQWADGAIIQHQDREVGIWFTVFTPQWDADTNYRIKPKNIEVDLYIYATSSDAVFVTMGFLPASAGTTVYKKTITLTEDDKI